MPAPKSLIINSPYEAPRQHWQQARMVRSRAERRAAGYEIFDIRNNTRRTEPLTLVNEIRKRVDEWRAAEYPRHYQSITRSLLEHWNDQHDAATPFIFCQLEAIETLIWWVEAATEFKQGFSSPVTAGRGSGCATRWPPAPARPR